jgi:hypothetical protein
VTNCNTNLSAQWEQKDRYAETKKSTQYKTIKT